MWTLIQTRKPPGTPASAFKGPTGPLLHRCAQPQCRETGSGLLQCRRCRAVRYCSNKHRITHGREHRPVCNEIKQARTDLAKEEGLIRSSTPGFTTIASFFGASTFWEMLTSHAYLSALLKLAKKLLLPVGTLDGLQEGVEHLQDLARFCGYELWETRYILPAAMLRLDLDQESYDYAIRREPTLPQNSLLNIAGADVFDNPHFFGAVPELDYVVVVLLLKLKLLIDIRNIKVTRKILSAYSLPLDVHALIEPLVFRSPLSAQLQRAPLRRLLGTEANLIQQARELGAKVGKAIPYFMFDLFEPDQALECNLGDPRDLSQHTPANKVARVLQNSYAAFWETEGVLDLLNDARACAVRDPKNGGAEGMMKVKRCRPDTRALEEVVVEPLWDYLDVAVADASYLGPWSTRPSERRLRKTEKEE